MNRLFGRSFVKRQLWQLCADHYGFTHAQSVVPSSSSEFLTELQDIEGISEGDSYSYSNTISNFSAKRMDTAGAEKAGTFVQVAKLIVTANVTITFITEYLD